MHLDDALLEETNGSRILKDLAERELAATGRSDEDPTVLAPLAPLEAWTGAAPSADLRRFCLSFDGRTLADGRFAIALPDPADNGWEALIADAGAGQAALNLLLHRAVPIGSLRRPEGPVALGLLLEDLWGFRAGRVLATGGPLGADLARVDKRLGTFLYHLGQDQGQAHSRSAAEDWPRWSTRCSWISAALGGAGLPEDLGSASFLTLNPALDAAEVARTLQAGPADRIQLLWRGWLLGEDAVLEPALRACSGGATRLEQDAAALVRQLLDGRDAVGPWTGIAAQRAATAPRWQAALAAHPNHPGSGRLAVPAPAPSPAPEAPVPPDPSPARPSEAAGALLPKPFRPAGSPIPGPPTEGWPTQTSSFKPVVHPWARTAVVLGLVALPVLFFGTLCSGC